MGNQIRQPSGENCGATSTAVDQAPARYSPLVSTQDLYFLESLKAVAGRSWCVPRHAQLQWLTRRCESA